MPTVTTRLHNVKQLGQYADSTSHRVFDYTHNCWRRFSKRYCIFNRLRHLNNELHEQDIFDYRVEA
jgi:hypothetical protein